jgi:hypothetical protein
MSVLYRVFRDRAHADEFLAGAVRFGHLGYYRALETRGRGDQLEGRAHHSEHRPDRTAVRIAGGESREILSPGTVAVRTECGNDVFVCSFTHPPEETAWERIRGEFGDVVVQIDDAERLLDDIRSSLDANDPWQRGACVMLWPAEYTKGLELPRRSRDDSVRLAVTQKPPSYSYQYEHRIALISYGTWQVDGRPPDFTRVRLPHKVSYARVSSLRLATAP